MSDNLYDRLDVKEIEFKEFYEVEFDKIPKLFKFGKERMKVLGIILGSIAGVVLIMLMIIPWTKEFHDAGLPLSSTGANIRYTTYSVPLTIAIVVCILIALLLLLWIGLSIEFEKRAYRIATRKHQEYRQMYLLRMTRLNNDIKRKYGDY